MDRANRGGHLRAACFPGGSGLWTSGKVGKSEREVTSLFHTQSIGLLQNFLISQRSILLSSKAYK